MQRQRSPLTLDLSPYTHTLLLSEPTVAKLYGAEVLEQLLPGSHLLTVPSGEGAKTLSVAERVWKEMQHLSLPRSTLLVALGGGALCDLANFVGGCYMRGIDTVLIPTTLLAMVDAAIGGKCGINLGSGKNAIGLIRQPIQTVIDPSYLESLPIEEFRSGMAECIKAGIVGDPDLFTLLESGSSDVEQIIQRSIDVKQSIVERDEREESGLRSLLNLGHTFGHAIESTLGWGALRHGEAVAIGLVCAAELSCRDGFCSPGLPLRIERICTAFNLPTRIPNGVSTSELLIEMQKDKKNNTTGVTCVLIKEIGSVFLKKEICDLKIKPLLIDLGASQ